MNKLYFICTLTGHEVSATTIHSCLFSHNWTLSCPSDVPGQYIDVIHAYGGYSHNWTADSCTDIDYEYCTQPLDSVRIDCNARTNCTVSRGIVTQMDLQEPIHCPGPGNFIHIEYRCLPGTYTFYTAFKTYHETLYQIALCTNVPFIVSTTFWPIIFLSEVTCNLCYRPSK